MHDAPLPLTERQQCLHCKSRVAVSSRGLCTKCGRDREIRAFYFLPDATRNKNLRGAGVMNLAHPPLAPEPTETPVGSPERIEVMAQRLADGYAIFHPEDLNEAGERTGAGGNNSDPGPRLYPRCKQCGRKYAHPVTQCCTETCLKLWNESNPKTKAFAGLKPKRTA